MINRDWLDALNNDDYAAFIRDCMSQGFCDKYCPRVDCWVETHINEDAFSELCLKNILIWLNSERGN